MRKTTMPDFIFDSDAPGSVMYSGCAARFACTDVARALQVNYPGRRSSRVPGAAFGSPSGLGKLTSCRSDLISGVESGVVATASFNVSIAAVSDRHGLQAELHWSICE